MLSRSSALILSLTSLSAGVLLGVVLARGGPAVSAQVAAPAAGGQGGRGAPKPSRRRRLRPGGRTKRSTTRLGRQYELFRQVNQTFEMVAKAVSPTVVHIVAHKTHPGGGGRRPRNFEETGSGVIVRSERVHGLYILTNHHVVENTKPAKIQILPPRRPVAPAGPDLERREGRHRRPEARPRRPAGGPDGQQRRGHRWGAGSWPWGVPSA